MWCVDDSNTIQTYAQFFSYTIPVFAACRLHEIYFTFRSKTFLVVMILPMVTIEQNLNEGMKYATVCQKG